MQKTKNGKTQYYIKKVVCFYLILKNIQLFIPLSNKIALINIKIKITTFLHTLSITIIIIKKENQITKIYNQISDRKYYDILKLGNLQKIQLAFPFLSKNYQKIIEIKKSISLQQLTTYISQDNQIYIIQHTFLWVINTTFSIIVIIKLNSELISQQHLTNLNEKILTDDFYVEIKYDDIYLNFTTNNYQSIIVNYNQNLRFYNQHQRGTYMHTSICTQYSKKIYIQIQSTVAKVVTSRQRVSATIPSSDLTKATISNKQIEVFWTWLKSKRLVPGSKSYSTTLTVSPINIFFYTSYTF
eukprot:TRINITY_DN595_c1_g2_i8.p2 TRINITY_DN595_c1_g2~~TRINITY_DN595_c1_g2_i8.p2  ORF type:complete len:299 (+),score=-13.51 TRINITY_DN595_c1_g2_i8:433-1329(+)